MKGYNSDYGGGGNSSSSSGPVNGKDYNTAGSSAVGNVDSVSIVADEHSLPTEGTANSVTKNYKEGKLDQERYYGDDGKMYLIPKNEITNTSTINLDDKYFKYLL